MILDLFQRHSVALKLFIDVSEVLKMTYILFSKGIFPAERKQQPLIPSRFGCQ